MCTYKCKGDEAMSGFPRAGRMCARCDDTPIDTCEIRKNAGTTVMGTISTWASPKLPPVATAGGFVDMSRKCPGCRCRVVLDLEPWRCTGKRVERRALARAERRRLAYTNECDESAGESSNKSSERGSEWGETNKSGAVRRLTDGVELSREKVG